MNHAEKEQKRNILISAVDAGAKIEDLCGFLLPELNARRNEIIDEMETKSYYQNSDNRNELLALQIELTVIRRLVSQANALVKYGKEARDKLVEMAEHPERPKAPRPLRF